MSNLMKIRQAGAELLDAHGRSDSHDDADSLFLQFLLMLLIKILQTCAVCLYLAIRWR